MKSRILKIVKWFGFTLVGIFLLITAGLYLFKDEICGAVISEVNKHLKAKVSVAEVDLTFWGSFPNLSVDFNHVYVQDALEKSTKTDTLLYSERIRLKFNPIDIWNEEYRVRSVKIYPGCLHLKVNNKGEVNYDIFKEAEDTIASPFKFELEKVNLENVRFSYQNKVTAQTYQTAIEEMNLSGDFTEKQFSLRASSRLKVEKAKSGEITLLSNRKASFDLELKVNQESGTVALNDALIYISDLPFKVNGKVTPNDLHFNVQSKNIQLADLATNFSVQQVDEIKKFDGKGKVYFNLDVNGEVKNTAPTLIDCDFGISNGELTEPINRLRIRNIHLDGKYSNRGGEEKEFLKLADMRFSTAGGPFSGDLMLTKFKSPHFEGNAAGNIDLNVLNALFHIPMVETVNGNMAIHTDFDINAEPRADETMDYRVDKLEGDVEMRSVNLKIIDDKRTFRNVNGRMYLRNDEAGIEKVKLELGSSDFEIDGVFKNIISYLKNTGELNANVQLKSSNIDVSDLGTTSKEEKIQDGRQFVLPEDIGGSVFLEVKKLLYEGHTFKDLSGNMVMGNRILHFPQLALTNAGAKVTGSLTIDERSPEIFHLSTFASADNINFKALFREWNNFRQEVIGENNVQGKAQAKVYLEAPFDLRSGIISQNIKAEIGIRIQDGHLKNVEAFNSITKSLRTSSAAKLAIGPGNISLLEKKLQDLKFETLENTLIIRNGQMEIPSMLILSSALDVEVAGTHTFENKIDYQFAFRFRDLKEKNRESEFGEEEDDGTGMRVFMRMYGNLDDPTVEWDKKAKKDEARENREEAKQDAKSILKSEFGFFKNDTTVKIYQEKVRQKEVIEIQFGSEDEMETLDVKKPIKDSKLKNKLKTMKEESEKNKQPDVEFEVD